jgi:hypothetical protein
MAERETAPGEPGTIRPEFLDKEQAELLLRAHKRAILKLATSGKPLPAATVKQVMSVLSGGDATDPPFAKNQVELAAFLGVNRRTISRYLKVEGNPGAKPDGRYPVGAWRQFLADAGAIDDLEDDPSSLKARLVGVQIEKIEHSLAVSRGEYWERLEVQKWFSELAAAIRKVVTQIHLVAPSVVGVSVPEAEARLKDLEDEIMRQLHQIGAQVGTPANESGS